MPTEVRLPQLGESVTHARLSVWLKQEGERVTRGEVIAEVETDKTSVEIESPGEGVLSKIHVPAGTDKVAVDALLAVLDAGASAVAAPASELHARHEQPQVVHPADVRQGERSAAVAPAVMAANAPATAVAYAVAPALLPDPELAASPLARRMAHAAGIPLSTIRGSGAGGRIMKDDVEAATAPKPALGVVRSGAVAAPAVTVPLPHDDPSRYSLEQLSTMRRVSAERLTHSKQSIPHFYLRAECAMSEVGRVRDEINKRAAEKLSFTAFTIRAVALALKRVPAANAMWADGSVRLYHTVDVAVAVNTPQGLIAPIVRGADEKSVAAINRELKALAERARAGKLKPEEYTGGTCTVSNLGMFGVTSLYPIINPPQTCILGVGAIEARPVVREGALAIGLMMTATLAADHRALDGATGAELLAAFKSLVEEPLLLLL